MRLIPHLRRFGSEKKGLAALEFAIIAPVMVFLLFAAVDLIDALGANKRAQNVSASLADVVARDTSVSDAEITGLWSALDLLMFPDGAGDEIHVRISSISIVDASTARVMWSEGHGMAARDVNSTVALPAQMMTVGSSVIMAETTYDYDAPLHFLYPGVVHFSHSSYRRSRLVDPIPRSVS